jgi:hypothetical protein
MNKITLVHNWRDGWKWISTQCTAAAVALLGAWTQVPEDLKADLPPHLVSYAAIGLLVLGAAGRFIDQGKPPCP